MAVLGAVCVKNPDARLSVAFVSSIYPHSFSADSVGGWVKVGEGGWVKVGEGG